MHPIDSVPPKVQIPIFSAILYTIKIPFVKWVGQKTENVSNSE